jgi:hypothetical protein
MLCRLSALDHAINQATESDRLTNGKEIPKTPEKTTVDAVSLCCRSLRVVTCGEGLCALHHTSHYSILHDIQSPAKKRFILKKF